MQVKKRDGSFVARDVSKIRECVKRACNGLADVDAEVIVQEAIPQLFDGIETSQIDNVTIMSARSRIVYEPNYSHVAARLLLNSLYKEVFGEHVDNRWFDKQYRNVFIRNLKTMVEYGRLDGGVVAKFDLEKLAEAIMPERDKLLRYLGVQTLYDRYFIHHEKRRLETPQALWMRVAMGLTHEEENPTERAIEAYTLFSTLRYCPSTPTLFNSCTLHPQMSSCYLSTIGDSIDQIFGGMHNQARLSKYAGGLGVSWSGVRSALAYIKGTNGESQGVVPWMKIFNDTLVAVNQGGKRHGAGCSYLEPNHGDFLEFLELRKNTGDERRRTHNMHTAAWIPDEFMKRVQANDDWYMFSPDECPSLHQSFGQDFSSNYAACIEAAKQGRVKNFSVIKAKDLWRKMLTAILETGHPWITFKCPSNLRYSNSHVGVVNSSNLCTEILLHTKETWYSNDGDVTEVGETAVCNLGSVNLYAHLDKQGRIDYDLLRETVRIAIRLLDNVVDINFYPTKESAKANSNNRPIGLGTMGWADVFHENRIEFDSEEAIELRSKVMEFVSYNAIIASAELAGERGVYPNYDGSTWSSGLLPIDTYRSLMRYRGRQTDVKRCWEELEQSARECVADLGMRNSNVMAVAPTATISYIVGCSQSIEPDFSPLFVYSTLSGEFTMINSHFVSRMKEIGGWNETFANQLIHVDGDLNRVNVPEQIRREFRTAFQLNQLKIVEAAAAAQVWIDMGQSLNLYVDTKSLRALNDIYFHAWELGLKTTYYLRTLGASRIEKATEVITTNNGCAGCGQPMDSSDSCKACMDSEPPPLACSILNPDCESCQ